MNGTGDRFDVIVLGMGPGGEVAAGRLLQAGRSVAVVERELIGGECAYWACIPSKTLLRPPETRAEAARVAGATTPGLDWAEVRDYRDSMVRNLDDAGQVDGYRNRGATVVKGAATITAPGTVEVDGRSLRAEDIIVATGSEAVTPPIEGVDDVPVWTNREATTLREIPERAVVLGGGPVGIELGQMLARYGTEVTLVEMADRLIGREDAQVSRHIQEALEADGITVKVGRQVHRARDDGHGVVAKLDDGQQIGADVLLAATGRAPRSAALGLESLGVEPGPEGLAVDERCQVTDGLWAVGDVTGVLPFTHVAMYQARVAADNLVGRPRSATYRGIPRVVFSDPEIAAAGLTEAQAREQGMDVATVTVDLPKRLARPWTYEREPRGHLGLVADRARGVLVGAWAVAPLAGEWIHQASLAIRGEVSLDVLLDGVAQFPTYSECYLEAVEALDL